LLKRWRLLAAASGVDLDGRGSGLEQPADPGGVGIAQLTADATAPGC
jgi:hypothetical protein